MPIGPPVSAIALVKVSVHGGGGASRVGEGGAECSGDTGYTRGRASDSEEAHELASLFTGETSSIAVCAQLQGFFSQTTLHVRKRHGPLV